MAQIWLVSLSWLTRDFYPQLEYVCMADRYKWGHYYLSECAPSQGESWWTVPARGFSLEVEVLHRKIKYNPSHHDSVVLAQPWPSKLVPVRICTNTRDRTARSGFLYGNIYVYQRKGIEDGIEDIGLHQSHRLECTLRTGLVVLRRSQRPIHRSSTAK